MRRLLSYLALCPVLWAGTWPDIPPAVWALHEDPAREIKGAVILEQHLRFTRSAIEHLYRVRILSEAGRSAADIMDLLPESTGIDGRTVCRDGRVIPFNQLKDFQTKTLPGEGRENSRKALVPPGVTADCVVEMRWKDLFNNQESVLPPSLGSSAVWRLLTPFLTQTLVVENDATYQGKVFVLPGSAKPEVVKNGGSETTTFHDLPGRESTPFSLAALSGRPMVMAWSPASVWRADWKPKMGFWWNIANCFYKPYLSEFPSRKAAYRALSKELLAGLPKDTPTAASMLLRRLDKRIRNISQATLDETGTLDTPSILTHAMEQTKDLEAIATRGAATEFQMDLLFLSLLKDAGIKPLLAFTRNRGFLPFHPEVPDTHQADTLLIGVKNDQGNGLWLDPSQRFADPGLILPEYQGFDALVIDTADWKPRKETLPIQPARYNATTFLYQISLAADTEHFQVFASFSGAPEYETRQTYLRLAPQDQDHALKGVLETALPNAVIQHTKVKGATDPDVNVSWEAQGTLDLADGPRTSLAPFPSMPAPLSFPEAWPDRRTEPIVLPYLAIQSAQATITLPKGYRWVNQAPFVRENAFGKVLLRMDPDPKDSGGPLTVRFEMETRRLVSPPETYGEFRTFVRWVEEACRAKVLLEKSL